jgi:hypothetical protein
MTAVFPLLCQIGLGFLVLAVTAAMAFEQGRASMRREIQIFWSQHRCRECGAEPRATLIHVTGCASGWPSAKGPEQFPLPGSES